MSSTDNRIVQMQFDNAQFEKNVKQTMDSLDKLESSLQLNGASKGMQRVSDESRTLCRSMSNVEDAAQSVKLQFDALQIAGITVMMRLTNAAIDAGKKINNAIFGQIASGGWNRSTNIENAKFQLKGLGVEWASIKKDIDYGVQDTAYGLDEAAKVASQLAASNIGLGQAFKLNESGEEIDLMGRSLRAISGVAAMTNSTYGEIGDIFTTIASNGKLMTMQLRQLSARGLNVSATLAKEMDKTEEEINDLVSKGKVSFQEFADAMDSAFGEHAKAANETFSGALANVKSALSRIGEKFITPIRDNLKDILNTVRPIINTINAGLTPIATSFENQFGFLTKNVRLLMESEDFLEGIRNIMSAIYSFIKPIFNALFDLGIWKNNVNGMAASFREWTETLGLTNDRVEAMTVFVKNFIAALSIAKNVIQAIFTILSPIWKFLTDGLFGASKRIAGINQQLYKVYPYINEIIQILAEFAASKLDAFLGKIFAILSTFDFNKIKAVLKGAAALIFVIIACVIKLGAAVAQLVPYIIAGVTKITDIITKAIGAIAIGLAYLKNLFPKIFSSESAVKAQDETLKRVNDVKNAAEETAEAVEESGQRTEASLLSGIALVRQLAMRGFDVTRTAAEETTQAIETASEKSSRAVKGAVKDTKDARDDLERDKDRRDRKDERDNRQKPNDQNRTKPMSDYEKDRVLAEEAGKELQRQENMFGVVSMFGEKSEDIARKTGEVIDDMGLWFAQAMDKFSLFRKKDSPVKVFFDGIIEKFELEGTAIGNALVKIRDVLDSVVEFATPIVEFIAEKVQALIDLVTNPVTWILALINGLLIGTISLIASVIINAIRIIWGIADLLVSLSKALQGVYYLGKAAYTRQVANVLLSIAAIILSIGIGMLAIAAATNYIDADGMRRILTILDTIGTYMIKIALIIALISFFNSVAKKFETVGKFKTSRTIRFAVTGITSFIIGISLLIGTITAAMLIFKNFNTDEWNSALLKLVEIIGVILAFTLIIGFVYGSLNLTAGEFMKHESLFKFTTSNNNILVQLASLVVGLGIGIVGISAALKIMDTIDEDKLIIGLIGVVVILAELGAIAIWLSHELSKTATIISNSVSPVNVKFLMQYMNRIALIITALSVGVRIIASSIKSLIAVGNWYDVWIGIGAVSVIILAILGLTTLMAFVMKLLIATDGWAAPHFADALESIAKIIGHLIVFVGLVSLLVYAFQKVNDWESIKKVGAILVLVVLSLMGVIWATTWLAKASSSIKIAEIIQIFGAITLLITILGGVITLLAYQKNLSVDDSVLNAFIASIVLVGGLILALVALQKVLKTISVTSIGAILSTVALVAVTIAALGAFMLAIKELEGITIDKSVISLLSRMAWFVGAITALGVLLGGLVGWAPGGVASIFAVIAAMGGIALVMLELKELILTFNSLSGIKIDSSVMDLLSTIQEFLLAVYVIGNIIAVVAGIVPLVLAGIALIDMMFVALAAIPTGLGVMFMGLADLLGTINDAMNVVLAISESGADEFVNTISKLLSVFSLFENSKITLGSIVSMIGFGIGMRVLAAALEPVAKVNTTTFKTACDNIVILMTSLSDALDKSQLKSIEKFSDKLKSIAISLAIAGVALVVAAGTLSASMWLFKIAGNGISEALISFIDGITTALDYFNSDLGNNFLRLGELFFLGIVLTAVGVALVAAGLILETATGLIMLSLSNVAETADILNAIDTGAMTKACEGLMWFLIDVIALAVVMGIAGVALIAGAAAFGLGSLLFAGGAKLFEVGIESTVGAIANGIDSIASAIEHMCEAIDLMIETGNNLKETGTEFVETASSIWGGTKTAATGGFSFLTPIAGAMEMIPNVIDNKDRLLDDLIGFLWSDIGSESARDYAVDAYQALIGQAEEAGTEAGAAYAESFVSSAETSLNAADLAEYNATKMTESVSKNSKKYENVGKNAANSMVAGFKSGTAGMELIASQTADRATKAMNVTAKNNLGGGREIGRAWMDDLAGGAKEGAEENADEVANAQDELFRMEKRTDDKKDQLVAAGKEIGSSQVDGYVEGVTENLDANQNTVGNKISSFFKDVLGIDLSGFGFDDIGSFFSGMFESFGISIPSVDELMGSIASALGLDLSGAGFGAGMSWGDAFLSIIKQVAPELVDQLNPILEAFGEFGDQVSAEMQAALNTLHAGNQAVGAMMGDLGKWEYDTDGVLKFVVTPGREEDYNYWMRRLEDAENTVEEIAAREADPWDWDVPSFDYGGYTPVVEDTVSDALSGLGGGGYGSDVARDISSGSGAGTGINDLSHGGNTINSNNTYNFVQNNYSPEALDRTEIYQQTQYQLKSWYGWLQSNPM